MMLKISYLLLCSLFIFVGSTALYAQSQPNIVKCGKERWPVKTGTDLDIDLVDCQVVHESSISELRKWPVPPQITAATPRFGKSPIKKDAEEDDSESSDDVQNHRISLQEKTVYQINATLVDIGREDDSDYHLVLLDGAGNTMIAEAPLAACAQGSLVMDEISKVRSEIDQKLMSSFHRLPGGSWMRVNLPVKITGIGFFDFIHGQRGVAPNGIELHPILDIEFLDTSGN